MVPHGRPHARQKCSGSEAGPRDQGPWASFLSPCLLVLLLSADCLLSLRDHDHIPTASCVFLGSFYLEKHPREKLWLAPFWSFPFSCPNGHGQENGGSDWLRPSHMLPLWPGEERVLRVDVLGRRVTQPLLAFTWQRLCVVLNLLPASGISANIPHYTLGKEECGKSDLSTIIDPAYVCWCQSRSQVCKCMNCELIPRISKIYTPAVFVLCRKEIPAKPHTSFQEIPSRCVHDTLQYTATP